MATGPVKLEGPEQWRRLFADVDTVLFDCDGVLWVGSADPVPGAAKTIDYIRNLGKKIRFVTNNSSKSREQYLKKFTSLNFNVKKADYNEEFGRRVFYVRIRNEEIFTSGYVAARYLSGRGYKGKVYLVCTSGTKSEFEQLGMECIGVGVEPVTGTLDDWLKESLDPDVGAVVVGYDDQLSYMKMFRAASYLNRPGCIFVATNEDSRLPTKGEIVIPGTGCFVAAVKYSAERDPIVVGKPHRPTFDCVSQSVGELEPSRTLMVGDRLQTDIMFGKNHGLKTLAVLTGIVSEEDVLNAPVETRPDYYATSISGLLTSNEN